MEDVDQQIDKLSLEIEELSKTKDYGIDTDQLTAFIQDGKIKWNFKDNVLSRKNKLQMAEIKDNLANRIKELDKSKTSSEKERLLADELATKQTLELVLEKFDYNELTDTQNIEPELLAYLAGEIYIFLVVNGGRAGLKHLQMQQKLDTLNRLIISKASLKNGNASSDTKTASDQ